MNKMPGKARFLEVLPDFIEDPPNLQVLCEIAMKDLPEAEAKACVLIAAREYDKHECKHMTGLEKAQQRPPIFRKVEEELLSGLTASLKLK